MPMTEAHPAPSPAGLLAAGQPVPLLGVSVEADVKDFASRVVMTQRYHNAEKNPIEAVYVFPLEEGAAVSGFEAIIDGLHVVGEVQEKERAFETYDDAMASGHGAYLLDQERPDVFTASIGNVPPGKEVLVRITYVAELAAEGDDVRFALPTTVSPRYAPAEDQKGVGRPPSETLNPPREWKVPYGLDLTVRIEMASAIRSVESPSHPVRLELDGRRATVTLGGRETALDKDFVLNVKLAEAHAPRAWVERDERGRKAVLVAFQPGFDVEEAPSELIFLVDRSGSMEGTSIEEARNALQLCLRSLNEGTRFNIVGFGNAFKALFSDSRPYDEKSLKEASDHVARMQADLGGTEILAPLEAILQKPSRSEMPRQVFVITDGQVTNTDAVIKLVRKHSDTTRVFTFGIGAGASHHLVRGIARAGGGTAEFIAPGERIEAKVLRQLGKAMAPALTDVKLDWGGLRVRQAPFTLPPVFAGGRALVYGFVEDGPVSDVTLSARGPRGPVSFSLRVDLEAARPGHLLATLTARTLIRDLEEGSSPLHDRKGSLQERGGKTDRVKEEIVRLGVEYGLTSAHTSFVGVEKREKPVAGATQLRRVPIAVTSGWGGMEGSITGSFPLAALDAAMPAAAASWPAPTGMKMRPAARAASAPVAGAARGVLFDKVFRSFESTPLPSARQQPVPPSPPARPLDALVALQRADGAWELDEVLAQALGQPLSDLEKKLGGQRDEQSRRALATALALAWLESHAKEAAAEWALLAKKARKWLGKCSARPPGGGTWLEVARY